MTELITLILDEGGPDGTYVNKGYVTIASSLRFPDSSDAMIIGTKSKQVRFDRGVSPPQVTLYPCDLIGPQNDDDTPGWSYTISYSSDFPGQPRTWSFQLLSTNGTTQYLRDLASIPVALPGQSYVPWPNTPPTDGELFGWDGSQVVGVPQLLATGPVSRRPAWRPASWMQLFQSGHGWSANGSGVGSSNMNDTSTFVKGTQCATITTAANGVQANFVVSSMSAVDMTGKALRLTFKATSVTNLNYMIFYLGTASFTNYFVFTVHTHSTTGQNIVQEGEWVTLTVSWADVQTAHGSFSLSSGGKPSVTSGFTCMELAMFDNAAGAVTVHLQSVEIIPDTVNTFPNGVCSIVFDDSYGDVWTNARPIMDSYGYRGTSYTIVDAIGAGGSLTLAQLQSLQDLSGWEIAGHAFTTAAHNAGYETLTAQQVDDEMRSMRAWLINNGFPLDSFAYPKGFFSATTDNVPVDQIAAKYFSNARSIVSETAETFPPGMPYRLRSKSGISSAGTAVSTLTGSGNILDRIVNSGGWFIATLHDIITGTVTTNTQISVTDFTTLLAAINSRGIPVLPVGDVIRNYG